MKISERIKDSISNWSRFQQIVKVLGKHGFASLLHEMGISGPLPFSKTNIENKTTPTRLRLAFEELGPTFIKLGQILSTRPDLLPQEYIEEFSKLTDHALEFEFSIVEEILEQEFSRPYSEIFSEVEEKPIAAASISQVHRAKLLEGDSKDVVIKVQRPNIEENIQSDIQILYFMAKSLEKIRKEFLLLNLPGIVREFQKSIYEEMDFSLEAKNIEDLSANVRQIEGIHLPKVVWVYSSKKVLTMTELKGTPLSQMKDFPKNIDRQRLAHAVASFFLESIFFHGVFHCDAHSGNIIVQTEGKGSVGLVDFGMVGRIGPDLRDKMSRIFLALVTRDFSSLALIYTEVASFGRAFSLQDFKRDLEQLLEPNLSKPLGDVDVGQMMFQSIHIAQKYQVQLPRDLILFYRAIVTLEHVGRTLDPQFTFLKFGSEFSKRLIQNRLRSDNIMRDLFRFLEGMRSLGTEIPGQLKSLLYRIEAENFGSNGKSSINTAIDTFKRSNQLLTLAMLNFALLLSCAILTSAQPQHLLVWPLWGLSGLSLLIMFFRLLKP